MPSLFIHASDVAACCGLHPYRSYGDVLMKYLKRIDGQAYERVAERDGYEDPEVVVSKALTKLDANSVETINDMIANVPIVDEDDTTARLLEITEKTTEICLQSESLTEIEKDAVVKHYRSTAYSGYGTRKESHTLDDLRRTLSLGPDVELRAGDGTYRKRYAFSIGKYSVFLGGRIDASSSDGRVVEIKNRVHRLFCRVVEYEKIQTMTYAFIFGAKDAWLVENYEGQLQPHLVTFDAGWFSSTIIQGLRNFTQDIQDRVADEVVPS